MRTRIGLTLMALAAGCAIVLLATTYVGYVNTGVWHTGVTIFIFDIAWDSHWMWIAPICVMFGAGTYLLIFPNYPAMTDDERGAVRLHDSFLRGYGPEDDSLYE